jgi:membrane-associated phospholipid phosphatase
MFHLVVLLAMQGAPPIVEPAPRVRITAQLEDGALVPVRRAPDTVLIWNDAALDAIRAEKTPPPMAARNLAMMHAAIYEVVNAVERTHWYYVLDIHPPECTSPEAAAAVAAHRVLVALYPRQAKRFDAVLRATLPGGNGPTVQHGVVLGQFVAEQMLAWRADDGSSRHVEHQAGYSPGVWRPTPPRYLPALYPQWPRVTPFALTDISRFRPPPPPALSSPAWTAAYLEVKALGKEDSLVRTPDQTTIAHFWADGEGTVTPPGHWNRIARSVALSRGTSLAENARLFALLNIALADVGIACWDCKYRFNLWRPIDAIREASTGADRSWKSLLVTPPFPSYTSGHSSFSGAGAAVLASFFGNDALAFTSDSDGLPGVTRSYNSFWAAAQEAGRSRIYGGIHYEFDNSAGLSAGQAIGRFVARRLLQPRPPEQCPPNPKTS